MWQRLKDVKERKLALVSVVAVVRCYLYDAHVSDKRMKRKNEVNKE